MADGAYSDQLSTKGRASILPSFSSDADFITERGGLAQIGERYVNIPKACVRIFLGSVFVNEGDRTGVVKQTINPNPDPGYLLLDGSTIGDVGSGADFEGAHFFEIYELVKLQAGNNPLSVFGNGDVVTLMDGKGKQLFGLDSGDVDFDTLGKSGGNKSQAGTHAHNAGAINASGSHDHAGGTYNVTVPADGAHDHGGRTSFIENRVTSPRIIDASNNIGDDHDHSIPSEPAHDHGGNLSVSGNSSTDGSHIHTQDPTANADVNINTLSPFLVVQYQIKI